MRPQGGDRDQASGRPYGGVVLDFSNEATLGQTRGGVTSVHGEPEVKELVKVFECSQHKMFRVQGKMCYHISGSCMYLSLWRSEYCRCVIGHSANVST